MFRRLVDRIGSLVTGEESTDDSARMLALQSMGFEADQARGALQTTNGDVDRAAELLLAGGADYSTVQQQPSLMPPSPPPTTTRTNNNTTTPLNQEEGALQRALQESMQFEEERRMRMAEEASSLQGPPVPLQQMDTISRTAEAAEKRVAATRSTAAMQKKQPAFQYRASFQYQEEKRRIQAKSAYAKLEHDLLHHHHPKVKVPAKLQDKSKEEQILRCGDRLKPYPAAVDTLYRALTAVQKDPDNDKFRKIDKTTAGYQRSVEGVPGAETLLRAMNYTPRGDNTLVLERSQADAALLYLGISALEQAKESCEYKEGKRKIQFSKDVKEVRLGGDSSEVEAIQRANYMSKCPTEPSDGRGALMQVLIADETVRRRFDGDDVLGDVLNWLGGHGSVIPEKILTREWCLVDLNRYPIVPIDCSERNLNKTLQYIGCWPSGRLEVLPSGDEWRWNGSVGNVKPGFSRGLGSAPMDLS